MDTVEAIGKVLLVGLALGAGLPALFAIGLRLFLAEPTTQEGESVTGPTNPVARYAGIALFVLVAAVIIVAILWVTRNTIDYYFDVNLFPFAPKK